MGFKIGSVFSPEILSQVEGEKDRNLQRLRLQADLYSKYKDDKFRNAQLRAVEADNNADRSSRERMTRETNDTRQELGAMSNELRSAQIDARQASGENALLEKQRQFDALYPLKEKDAEARGTRAEASMIGATARKDQVDLNRQVQFGSGTADNPSHGSMASGRRAMEGKTATSTDLMKAQIQQIQARLAGTLPEDMDRVRRTAILASHEKLLERTLNVRTAKDAAALASQLIRDLRNPVTGSFNDPSVARAATEVSGSIFGILKSYGDEFAAAFANAFQEEGAKANEEDADKVAKTRKHAAPNPMPTGDDAAKRAMDVLNEMRRRAREGLQGTPPNTTGR